MSFKQMVLYWLSQCFDPLASAFLSWWFDIYDRGELSRYHPEREFGGRIRLSKHIYGIFWSANVYSCRIGNLFPKIPVLTCTIEKTAQLLWRRNIQQDDHTRLANIESTLSILPYRTNLFSK